MALFLPLLPPSAPHAGDRFTRASSGLQVEAGATEKNGTLSHHLQKGLLGSDTPRGGEVKGQLSRQWLQKKRPVWWVDFPSSSPPLPGHPLGAPQAGWWTYPSWLNFQAETSKITTRHLKSAFPAIPLSELFCSRSFHASNKQGSRKLFSLLKLLQSDIFSKDLASIRPLPVPVSTRAQGTLAVP